MPSINVTADVSGVNTASNKLVADLQKMDDRIGKVTSTIAVFNKQGVQIGATIQGLTKDGQTFTATLGLVDAAARKAAASGMAHNAQLSVTSIKYKELKKDVKDVVAETNSLLEVTGRMARSAQYFLAYRGFSFLANQLNDGVVAANKLQIQLSLIRTLSQDSQQTAAKFGADVRGVSDRTGFDINDTAKAFYDTVSNQVSKGAGVAPFVEEAAKLARLTDSTVTDSVNALTSTINAYNLKAEDAGRLSAIWFKTIDEGRINMGEVANTIGRVDAIASNLGISIEEVRSVLAVTTQQGFKTSDALTLLTNLMIKLEKPTQGMERLFKKWGVATGEQALQLKGGLVPVMKEIVEATRNGEAEISDFFDEIRGRKQAAIFETALPKIEELAAKMKNVNALQDEYNAAQDIRSESPADSINKRLNRFSNEFKEGFGQDVLKVVDQVIKGGDALADFAKDIEVVNIGAKALGITLTGYVTVLAAVRISTLAAAAATSVFGAASATAAGPIGALIAAIGVLTYVTADAIKQENSVNFGATKAEDVKAAIQTAKELKKAKESLISTNSKSSLEEIADVSKAKFREALTILAQVQVANDKILSETKTKAKESAEAIKLFFGTYTDRIKSGISEIKKGITDSTNEINKSAKSLLNFKTTLDSIVFDSQTKFATDEQKIQLTDNRIQSMLAQADSLLSSGDSASRDEGRKLVDEIARNIQLVEDMKQSLAAREADASGASVYMASTDNLQRRLAELFAFREEREKKIQLLEQQGIFKKTKAAEEETTRLRDLQQGFKKFEDFTLFDNGGKIKKDFVDGNGRFDEAKAKGALDKISDEIRASASIGLSERIQLEIQLSNHKLQLIREVAAAERSEYLKTNQAKLAGDKDRLDKAVAEESKKREELNGRTSGNLNKLDQLSQLFQEFAKAQKAQFLTDSPLPFGPQKFDLVTAASKKQLEEYNSQLFALQQQLKVTKDNAMSLNGVLVPREQDIAILEQQIASIENKAQAIQNLAGQPNKQFIADGVTQTDAFNAAKAQVTELKSRGGQAADSRLEEERLKAQRDALLGPIESLRTAFPDLIGKSDEAANRVTTSFQRMADGTQPLFDRVKALQAEMQKLNIGGAGPVSLSNEGDAAYAATGGLVGAFPGQPRGQDRYPVWAAKDEYIVNAQSSRMFRPMLEAINNRRAPVYMNGGGTVGGDTTVGDITVHVHNTGGGPTDGRTIARSIERELRRGTVKFRKS